MRFNSWDDKPEEQTIRDAATQATDRPEINFEMPPLGSFAHLRESLLIPAYMTVISGHGGPRNGGCSADLPEAWRLSGKDNFPWVTVPELLRQGDVIPGHIVFVAACHGQLNAWRHHLLPGALLIVTTHRVSYPAVRWMLATFLPLVHELEVKGAPACCIKEAWDRARDRAALRAWTLERDEFAYEIVNETTVARIPMRSSLHDHSGQPAQDCDTGDR